MEISIINGISIINDIPLNEIKITEKNLHSNFRVDCGFIANKDNNGLGTLEQGLVPVEQNTYNDNIYLVLCKQNGDKFKNIY